METTWFPLCLLLTLDLGTLTLHFQPQIVCEFFTRALDRQRLTSTIIPHVQLPQKFLSAISFLEISSSSTLVQNVKAVNNATIHKSPAWEIQVWLSIFSLTHDSQQSLIINVPKIFLILSFLFIKLATPFTQFLIISSLGFFKYFLNLSCFLHSF